MIVLHQLAHVSGLHVYSLLVQRSMGHLSTPSVAVNSLNAS